MALDIKFNVVPQIDRSGISKAADQIQRELGDRRVKFGVDFDSRSVGTINSLRAGLRGLDGEATRAATSMRTVGRVTVDASNFMENLATQAGLATRRFAAFTIAAGTMIRFGHAIRDAVTEAVDFDRMMTKISQISTESALEIKSVGDTVGRLATSLGVSSRDLVGVAEQLKQTGLSIKDVNIALEALAKASLAPSFGDIVKTTQGAIAALRQFNLETKDLEGALGSINSVAGHFAVESSDIIEAITRAGGAFRATGGDLQQFIGLFTSVRATTRESAESIATGLRTIFSRLQRGTTVDSLRELGVNLRYTREEAAALGREDLTHQFVGAYEAVRRLSEGLNGLRSTDPRYSQIVEQLGGFRQISRILPLLGQFETAQRAVTVAQAGQISLSLSAERAQDSLANQITKVKEAYLQVGREIISNPGFASLAKDALFAASKIADVISVLKPLLPLLTTIAAVKLFGSIGGIARNYTTSILAGVGTNIQTRTPVQEPLRKAGGGAIYGGVAGKDSVPALLMPGEYVLNREAVSNIGVGTLNALNSGAIKRYATGGPVGDDRDRKKFIDELVTKNYKQLSKEISGKKFAKSLDPNDLEDLLQNALIAAMSDFDPSKGIHPELNRPFEYQDIENKGLNALFRSAVYNKAKGGRSNEIAKRVRRRDILASGAVEPAARQSEYTERELQVAAEILAQHSGPEAGPATSLGNAIRGVQEHGLTPDQRARLDLPLPKPPAAATTAAPAEVGIFPFAGEPSLIPEGLSDPIGFPAPYYIQGQRLGRINDQSGRYIGRGRNRTPFGLGALTPEQVAEQVRRSDDAYGVAQARQRQLAERDTEQRFNELNDPALRRIENARRVISPEELQETAFRNAYDNPNRAGLVGSARVAGRIQNATEGFGGVTDPLQIRQLALQGKVNLDQVADLKNSGVLSTTQAAQINRVVSGFGGSSSPNALSLPDLIARRAGNQAQDKITSLGGTSVLSQATRAAIEETALKQQGHNLERELLSAQRRLLDATLKNASATERGKIAQEEVEAALKGEARIIINSAGQVLGTEGRVKAATAAGVPVPGAGGLGYQAGNFFGARGRFGRFLPRITQATGFAALLGAPLLAQQVENFGGTAEAAANSGSTAGFTTSRGISGIVNGAVIGGTAGSILPGYGTAIGAVVGGLTGLYQALKETATEIRDIKIGNTITTFANDLTTLNNRVSGQGPDIQSIQASSASLRAARQLVFEKSFEQSSGFFSGFDHNAFAANSRANIRREFGPQLGGITQFLGTEAEREGRRPGNESIDDRLFSFRAGNGGLNQRLVSISAETRGVGTTDVLRDLRQFVERGRLARQQEQRAESAREGEGRQQNQFNRLVLSLQGAADGLSTLRIRAQALAETFDGNAGAFHVSANTNALQNGLGGFGNGALAPLQLAAAVGGEQGSNLLRSGTAVNRVAQLLPSVLGNVASGNPLEGHAISGEVERQLLEGLGHTAGNAPRDIQAVISTVIAQLDRHTTGQEGFGNFISSVRTDTSHFTEQLLAPIADPIKEAGVRIGRLLEEEANHLSDGLASYRRQVTVAGENRDRLATLGVAGYRQNVEFQAQAAGRRNQAGQFLNLSVLESGFQARQERLTGLSGEAANNPELIRGQLTALRTQIQAGSVAQQQAFSQHGPGQQFDAAAQSLSLLKDRASNLEQALGHLANAGERNAAIQERLALIERERESRLSLGEHFFTSDDEGRLRLQRGFGLVGQATNQGSLDNFTAQEQRLIIETLRAAGGATLPGLGGLRADDIKNNLIRNSAGGIFGLNETQRAEEASLQNTAVGRQNTAEKSLQALITTQNGISQEFFANLGRQMETFFQRFSEYLTRGTLVNLQNERGTVQTRQGTNNVLADQRRLLANVGITSTEQLTSLQGRREQLTQLATAIDARNRLTRVSEEAVSSIANGPDLTLRHAFGNQSNFTNLFNENHLERIRGQLSNAGLTEPQIGQVLSRTSNSLYGLVNQHRDEQGNAVIPDIRLRTELQRNIGIALSPAQSQAGGEVIQRANALRDVPNLNIGEVANVLGSDQRQRFLDALGAFDASRNRLEALQGTIETTNRRFQELTQQIAQLQATLPSGTSGAPSAQGPVGSPAGPFSTGGTVYLAGGASVFRPRGTDTVPAMLTPGEFVINANSAKANHKLLDHINRASGPVYMAIGGRLGELQASADLNPYGRTGLLAAFAEDRLASAEFFNSPDEATANRRRFGVQERNTLRGPIASASVARIRSTPVDQLDDREKTIREVLDFESRQDLRRQNAVGNAANLYYAGQARGLAARQGLAQAVDTGAAFGAGRADFHGQLSVAQRVLAVGDQTEDIRNSPEVNALRPQRLSAISPQRFSVGGIVNPDPNDRISHDLYPPGSYEIDKMLYGGGGGNFEEHWRDWREGYDRFRERPPSDGVPYNFASIDRYPGFSGGGPNLKSYQLRRQQKLLQSPTSLDSVPALLTPGEGVLTRNAVSAIGGPNGVLRLNRGGVVGGPTYLATGGIATGGGGSFGSVGLSQSNERALLLFAVAANTFSQTLNVFAGNAIALAEAINKMPRQLTGEFTHTVNVNITGAQALAEIGPGLRDMVVTTTRQEMARVFATQMPDAGVQVN
jgi:TP901 family phage tail tape measure protein